jgi:hypothetical protein
VLAAVAPASATLIQFNFNSITLNNGITTDGLSGAANSTAITTYMNAVLTGSGSTAAVTGAIATLNYNADGFEFGQTLGTSDGATSYSDATHPSLATPDEFIMNNNFPVLGGPASDYIQIVFSNLALGAVSFDWEIFPYNSCSSTYCATHPYNAISNPNFPDMEFLVDGVQQGTTFYGQIISGHLPQDVGHSEFTLNLSAGTHTLRFVDWPAEIGIDNLSIETCLSTDRNCILRTVPEPSPLPLAGLALALLALVRWKARRGGGPVPCTLS